MKAWVVRGGGRGQDETDNLQRGRATIGWTELGDLTDLHDRDAVRARVASVYGDDHPGRQANYTGQLWAFRKVIQPGDLILMPLKSQPGHIAFGRCVGDYGFDPAADPHRRSYRPVEWQPDVVPRSVLQRDLLSMVNAAMTVFSPSRRDAAQRLAHIAEAGVDPGAGTPAVVAAVGEGAVDADVSDPAPAATLDAIRDDVRSFVQSHFREHDLTRLVAAILETHGLSCEVAPPGPDGGVDILAGTGPLGLSSPTVVVEVKSEPGPVGSSVLRTLHSAVTRYGADHGLLVAWGGVSKPAQTEFAHLRTTMRVWDGEILLEKLLDAYPHLPEEIRVRLPLTQAWVLADDGS